MSKDIFTTIDEIIENRRKILHDLEMKKAESEREQNRKEAEAAEILNSGTVEAYAEAKAASRTAADKVEFYTKKIEETEAADLFNKASRKEYKEKIDKSAEKEAGQALARCEAALTAALAAATEYRNTMKNAEDYCMKINERSHYGNRIMAAADRIRTITAEIDRPIFKGNK